MRIISCSQFGRFSNNLVNVYLGPHGTLPAYTESKKIRGPIEHPIVLKGLKSIQCKSGNNRGILLLVVCVVTLFVDGSKNVNKVGALITSSSHTI